MPIVKAIELLQTNVDNQWGVTMSDIIRRAAGYGLCDVCDEGFDSSTVLTQIFPWRSAAMADAWMCDDCCEELVTALTTEDDHD